MRGLCGAKAERRADKDFLDIIKAASRKALGLIPIPELPEPEPDV